MIAQQAAASLLTSTLHLEQGGVKFCLCPFCRTSPCNADEVWADSLNKRQTHKDS